LTEVYEQGTYYITESGTGSIPGELTIVWIPLCPTPVYPTDGAEDVLPELTLSWNSVNYIEEYFLTIYTQNSAYPHYIRDHLNVGTDTTYSIKLAQSTKYYWLVEPNGQEGQVEDCNPCFVWTFTTAGNPFGSSPSYQPFDISVFAKLKEKCV